MITKEQLIQAIKDATVKKEVAVQCRDYYSQPGDFVSHYIDPFKLIKLIEEA